MINEDTHSIYIRLVTVSNIFQIKLVKNANSGNFVQYGKTRIGLMTTGRN